MTGQGWVIESKEDGLTLMNYKAKLKFNVCHSWTKR